MELDLSGDLDVWMWSLPIGLEIILGTVRDATDTTVGNDVITYTWIPITINQGSLLGLDELRIKEVEK